MDQRLTEAVLRHGAKQVSDAAYEAMNGRRGLLVAVGLGHVEGLGALHQITVDAYAAMSGAERAEDLAEAAIKAAKL